MFNHIRKDFDCFGIFLLVIQHQSFGIKKNAIDSTVAFMRLEIPIGFGIAYIPNSVILVHFSRQDKGVEYFAGLKLEFCLLLILCRSFCQVNVFSVGDFCQVNVFGVGDLLLYGIGSGNGTMGGYGFLTVVLVVFGLVFGVLLSQHIIGIVF